MNISKKIRNRLYEEIWSQLKIGLSDAQSIISKMEQENHFQDVIQDATGVNSFVNGTLKNHLFPAPLSRLEVYDQKFIDDNGIKLDFVKAIPDGWDCNLYFDKKNNIYWEDNYGRYSKEGYIISPYINPLVIYK
ncbi:hypothetical protein [Halobacteriovorax sp.]|uniref:hypothetical protein n=1 Tax=Halobacteriovorax sp. TaxID=2020862 RepID=UPI00356690B1